MLIAYWAAKGGSGATVLAASHALRTATRAPTMLVDLDGDLPDALGIAAPEVGVSDWLAAGRDVPVDGLDRIGVPVCDDLVLVGRGTGALDATRGDDLAALLTHSARTVIADCGTRPEALARVVARAASRSVLVTRACYLSVRRRTQIDLPATELALVREEMRALGRDDIERAMGAPVRVQVKIDHAVARAVDAGLLASRMPRCLVRAFPHERRVHPNPEVPAMRRVS